MCVFLDAGDAHLEKLVHIAAANAQVLEAFEKWVLSIARVVEYASVKFEKRQVSIDEIVWCAEVDHSCAYRAGEYVKTCYILRFCCELMTTDRTRCSANA